MLHFLCLIFLRKMIKLWLLPKLLPTSISNSIEREHTPFVLYTAILKSSFVCFFSVNYSMTEKKRKDKETTGNEGKIMLK